MKKTIAGLAKTLKPLQSAPVDGYLPRIKPSVSSGQSRKDNKKLLLWGSIGGGLLIVLLLLSLLISNVTSSLPRAVQSEMQIVPAGQFYEGAWSTPGLSALKKKYQSVAEADEMLSHNKPRVVKLAAFKIDKCETSNKEYRQFLEHVRKHGDDKYRHPIQPVGKDHTPTFWNDPLLNADNQPVVGVDWFDAYAYSKWAGKQLPTGSEWEKAARGPDKRLYPWGNSFDQSLCVSREASSPTTCADHNLYRAGQSPYGVLHMAGNAWEWTADDFEGNTGMKTIRGGAYSSDCELYGVSFVSVLGASLTHRSKDIGFRCIQKQ